MRIVTDMQAAQTGTPEMRASWIRSLRALLAAASEKDQFHFLLNGTICDSVISIRHELDGLVPQSNIHTWQGCEAAGEEGAAPNWCNEASAQIRASVIASLKPAVVIVGNDAAAKLEVRIDVPVIVLLNKSASIGSPDTAQPERVVEVGLLSSHEPALIDETPGLRVLGDVGSPANILAEMRRIAACATESVNALPPKPRLAYFSPLPPQRSGIGDYSTELIPELARYYEIDVIVAQDEVTPTRATEHCRVRDVAWFRENVESYERVLYHVGNAEFHLYMLDCLESVSGVVVLHDFFLSGAYAYREFEAGVPYAWTQELYRSHGYPALIERCHAEQIDGLAFEYPSNFSVLRNAAGVIVHSTFSRKLANAWYGARFADDWKCIPHLRVAEQVSARAAARERLGLREDEFLVCSFGVLGVAKQNQRLLNAWLMSDLAADRRCKLVFVGENGKDEYARNIVRTIRARGIEDRVEITGWASAGTFRDYLAASDLAVQLRTFSRGETSGTVLDCMNYSLPVIVNACGSMADLPDDAVWMLPEAFDDLQLINALETLWKNPQQRAELGKKARAVILERHDPAACARDYAQAIEAFHEQSRFGREQLVTSISSLPDLPRDAETLAEVAVSISESLPVAQPARSLFFDVSVTSRTDLKTGIERVTRALLNEFLHRLPEGYRLEPVYLSDEGGEWHYRYARRYMLETYDCPTGILVDERIEPRAGDILFCSDLAADMVVRADQNGVYESLRKTGVQVSFMVHDLLPMTMPTVFPPGAGVHFEAWLKTVVRNSDNVTCVSCAVAEELRDWITGSSISRNERLRLSWSHHGADIDASMPTRGVPRKARKVLEELAQRPTFIAVGTIEPRKGYLQAIKAFELLWQQGTEVNFVIVGKEGWKDLPEESRRDIPVTINALKQHPERDHRLFWLEDISDEFLEQLYSASSCLLAPSLGEGFGLPLIEASRQGIPILARDIPVFREVAGNRAAYFSGLEPDALAGAIKQWLAAENVHSPAVISSQQWQQSAANLASILVKGDVSPEKNNDSPAAGILGLLPTQDRPCVYIDVSVISRDDYRTGIQRTVRALFAELVQSLVATHAVYPVRLAEKAGTWRYEFATQWFDDYCAPCVPGAPLLAGEIDAKLGDILLGLDLAGSLVVEAARDGLYKSMKEAGVHVHFVVYDLLPVIAPEFFPERDSAVHEDWLRSICDGESVICISRSVAEQFRSWYLTDTGNTEGMPFVSWFHLGADIAASVPTSGLPEDAASVFRQMESRPTFLAVGTLEPRKGYGQVLAGFTHLWADGLDVNLVIVGKQGWNVDALAESLRSHPEWGKRLFWLTGVSDEYLAGIYARSTCLLAASEGEGFGLPLIEAAQHGLPLLLREIPVFKEVAEDHAFYFNGCAAADLATAVREWLMLNDAGKAPTSAGIEWQSWHESAHQLIDVFLGKSGSAERKQTDGKREQ